MQYKVLKIIRFLAENECEKNTTSSFTHRQTEMFTGTNSRTR